MKSAYESIIFIFLERMIIDIINQSENIVK
jgi:hypothetical protein